MAADGSVVIEITGDDKGFKESLGSLGNIAHGALEGVGTAITAAVTAVSGLAVAAIEVGSNFESSMSQVAATMGITTDEIASGSKEFELLSQAAKDAGATTAFSASEAAEALNYLALAGYDAETAADALPAVLNLAAAGNMDLAYASDLATDAMAALGIEASNENLTQFGDEMARTASKANTSVAQLGEAILTVGGTAKSLAGGTVELNAALGVLANRGIKGSEGGTALRNVILALSAPTDKAAAAMKSLGVEAYDADGNLRPLNETFKDLDAAMADMSEGEKTQILNDIFNKVDLKSAQALLAGCGDEFDNLAEAIANSGGAMQDMADTQLDNLQGDITILKSGLEGLGIAAYESMNGPLREAVQLATSMVGEIAAAFNEGGITAAVGAIGDALAQVVTYIAGLAPQMIDAGIQLLQSLISGIQQNLPALAQGAVSIVTSLANGILELLPQLVIVAVQLITALANGVAAALPQLVPAAVQAITTLVQGLLDNLPALVDAALQLILGLAQGLIAAVPVLLDAIPSIISSLVNGLLGSIPSIIQAGIQLLTSLVTALPQIISSIVAVLPQIITAIVNALVSNIPLIMNAGVQLLIALVQNMPAIIAGIISAIPQIISAIIQGFLALIGSIVNIGVTLITSIWDGIVSMASWIGEQISNLFTGIVDGVKNLLGIGGNEAGTELMEGVADGTSENASTAESSASKAASSINSQLESDLSSGGERAGSGSMDGVSSGVLGNASTAMGSVDSTVASLNSQMLANMGTGGSEAGSNAMNQLASTATAALPDISSVGENTATSFTNGIDSQMASIQQTGTEIISSICEGMTLQEPEVVETASSIADAACSAIKSKSGQFQSVGINAMAGFNRGLESEGQKAIATANRIANQIISTMRSALSINSPSRKMEELVGKPAAQGVFVGFEDEMNGWGKRMQAAVNAETAKISVNAATQAEGKATASEYVREIHTNNKTVEKVARIEGDGLTDELVRILGLRLKDEDRRQGWSFDEEAFA